MGRAAGPFSALPSVAAILASPELDGAPHTLVVAQARLELDDQRARLRAGEAPSSDIIVRVRARVHAALTPRLRRVINATGIVLHTNLGRAPLPEAAARAVAEVARGYSNAELNLESGRRGGRLAGVTDHLCALTGAEAAIVVNNNAAAVLLALTALARDREVIVSRGELVEIGGSFRVPDVISTGGARLVEVGTTNRTRAADYEAAVNGDTAVILRVHPSNFRLVGFCERADRPALARLAQARGIPLVEDLGSGLIGEPPTAPEALGPERVEAALADGVDLVCFSGDKLLGGPQAGIIVGKAPLVKILRHHPLYRALRMDKLGLAALEATLALYRAGRAAEVPARALLARTSTDCEATAADLARRLGGCEVRHDVGFSGGGALPGHPLPGWVVVLPEDLGPAQRVARQLRLGSPAVVGRVADGRVLLDVRTLLAGDADDLVRRIDQMRAASVR